MLWMGMAEFELPPLRMTVGGPAVWVGGEGGQVVPADGRIGSAQRFRHGPPHSNGQR